MSITERIRYGAAELKSIHNRHLALAFVVSIAVHAIALGLYVFSVNNADAVADDPRLSTPPTVIREYEFPRVLPQIQEPATATVAPCGAHDCGGVGGSELAARHLAVRSLRRCPATFDRERCTRSRGREKADNVTAEIVDYYGGKQAEGSPGARSIHDRSLRSFIRWRFAPITKHH